MHNSSHLPIEAIKKDFCHTIANHNTVILSAPPGAGKSTCLPLWLLKLTQFKRKKIYLLQPRRLAVKNIALFLAEKLGEQIGETIGYRLRNEAKVSKQTQLEVITEGILTQIIQRDAELMNTALIVFDEFHERSLHGDLAFALAREVQQSLRDDLKILLMSATLNSESLMKALPDARALQSVGKSFPVDVSYLPPPKQHTWREHALIVIKGQIQHHRGSILVFLPGLADIRFLLARLAIPAENNILLCPLFGDLSLKEQRRAIAPCIKGQRKIVLATNIAETSLTIEGINLVIDSGLEKVAIYDSASLMNTLEQRQISKASAIQRAGRAGRLVAGQCIRLYAKDSFERRPEHSVNEIHQADLLPTLVEAARWGVKRLTQLPMLELPNSIREQHSWGELASLALVDQQNKLTHHGGLVAKLACHPRFAHMILSAKSLPAKQSSQLTSLACLIAALLEERDIYRGQQAQFDCNIAQRVHLILQSKSSDTNGYGVFSKIVKQAKVLAKSVGVRFSDKHIAIEMTGLLLAHAYPERVAKSRGMRGSYLCANGKGVFLSEQDRLSDEDFIVIADLMQVSDVSYVRLAASINLNQIEQVFSSEITVKSIAKFDEKAGKIIARKQTKLDNLVLTDQVLKKSLTNNAIAAMWCELIARKGFGFLHWQAKDLALRSRWQWLAKNQREDHLIAEALPAIDDKFMLDNLARWFSPFVGDIYSKTQLDKLNLSNMLLSLLDYKQQDLLKLAAPVSYIGPTGRHCPISYSNDLPPKVSLPMQEVYGLSITPSVGFYNKISVVSKKQGIPLLLELLSPAQRPIQLTQDLVQFWSGSYKAVQKEMKSRYPKHFWPDEPASSKPTNKTKRQLS